MAVGLVIVCRRALHLDTVALYTVAAARPSDGLAGYATRGGSTISILWVGVGERERVQSEGG